MCNEAIYSLFQVVYYVGKNLNYFLKFLGLCSLLMKEKLT